MSVKAAPVVRTFNGRLMAGTARRWTVTWRSPVLRPTEFRRISSAVPCAGALFLTSVSVGGEPHWLRGEMDLWLLRDPTDLRMRLVPSVPLKIGLRHTGLCPVGWVCGMAQRVGVTLWT